VVQPAAVTTPVILPPRSGHRDATAILVAYRHGLRASELVVLRWDDIDLTTGRLHVRRAKGGDASAHPISARKAGPCQAPALISSVVDHDA
jgi:integrase